MMPTNEERPVKNMRRSNEEEESNDKEERGVPQLPVELLHIIFKHYMSTIPERREQRPCKETKEIFELTQVNRTFQDYFLPQLWKHVCIYGAAENDERIYSRSCGRNVKGICWIQTGCGTLCERDIKLSPLQIPFIDSILESISFENSWLEHDICNNDQKIDWIQDDSQSPFGFRLQYNKKDDEDRPLCYWFTQQCMNGAENSLKEVNFDRALPPLTIPSLLPLWIFFERVGEWSCLDASSNIARDFGNGIAWLRRLLLQYEGKRVEGWVQALLLKECEVLCRIYRGLERNTQVKGLDEKPFDMWRLMSFLEETGFMRFEKGVGLVGTTNTTPNLCANLAKVVERLKARNIKKR